MQTEDPASLREAVRADKAIIDKGELEALAQLDTDNRHYDEGKAEEAELPF